jgi:GH15 family glucan-1,4-alpha-glucosidase
VAGPWPTSGGPYLQADRAPQVEPVRGLRQRLGLLAEEIDTAGGEQLGNFPQAFSHIGLITAAWEIDKARGSE